MCMGRCDSERVPPLDANVACRCDAYGMACFECYVTGRRAR